MHLKTDIVDNTPGAFLPSKLLEMLFKILAHDHGNLIPVLSFLTWCKEADVKKFILDFTDKLEKKYLDEIDREYWSQDNLYKNNDKEALQKLCKKNDVPAGGKKQHSGI